MNTGKIQVESKDVRSFFAKGKILVKVVIYSEKKTIAEYIKSLYTHHIFSFFSAKSQKSLHALWFLQVE